MARKAKSKPARRQRESQVAAKVKPGPPEKKVSKGRTLSTRHTSREKGILVAKKPAQPAQAPKTAPPPRAKKPARPSSAKKATTPPPAKRDVIVKEMSRGERLLARQMKHQEATRGARRVRFIVAKAKKQAEKKTETVRKGKKPLQGQKVQKDGEFPQNIRREIDRLRALEKENKQAGASTSTSSEIVTRRTRQNILESIKRKATTTTPEPAQETMAASADAVDVMKPKMTEDELYSQFEEVKIANDDTLPNLLKNIQTRCIENGMASEAGAAITKLDIVPKLVEILKDAEKRSMHIVALWFLINTASGPDEDTRLVYESPGLIDTLIGFLKSGDEKIHEYAINTLHNCAWDCAEYRHGIIKAGVLEPLASVLKTSRSKDALLAAVEMLDGALLKASSFSHGSDPHFETLLNFVAILKKLLLDDSLPDNVMRAVISSLMKLAEATDTKPQALKTKEFTEKGKNSICKRLVSLCSYHSEYVAYNASLALVGISSGKPASRTKAILDAGFLEEIPKLIKDPRVRISVILCLSNVVVSTDSQIKKVLGSGVLPLLFPYLEDCDPKMVEEVLWVIHNIMLTGNLSQQRELVEMEGLYAPLCSTLDPRISRSDNEVVTFKFALNVVHKILHMKVPPGEQHPCLEKFIACGGKTKLTALQDDPFWKEDRQVHGYVVNILQQLRIHSYNG